MLQADSVNIFSAIVRQTACITLPATSWHWGFPTEGLHPAYTQRDADYSACSIV